MSGKLTVYVNEDCVDQIPIRARYMLTMQGNGQIKVGSQLYPVRTGHVLDLLVRENDAFVQIWEDEMKSSALYPRILLKESDSLVLPGRALPLKWLCTCGNRNCAHRHRLSGWEREGAPTIGLWAHAASAIRGPSKTLKLGSLTQGMETPFLALEGFEHHGQAYPSTC